MTAPTVAVQLADVSATYVEDSQVLPVLDRVSFTVGTGELVAIIGPSGCGKSTLLDVIAGLTKPDAGEVRIDGSALDAPSRLGMSAYMHQRDLLLPWRTSLENAALSLEVRQVRKPEARWKATVAFDQFGLAGFEDKYPAQLSGGMRQRVAFVRTMLGGQSIVLLDEPFGSLDALTRMHAQDWLAAALADVERTMILVTHDIDEALYLADRVIVMSKRPGHIIESIELQEARPRSREFLESETGRGLHARLLTELGVVTARSGSAS